MQLLDFKEEVQAGEWEAEAAALDVIVQHALHALRRNRCQSPLVLAILHMEFHLRGHLQQALRLTALNCVNSAASLNQTRWKQQQQARMILELILKYKKMMRIVKQLRIIFKGH